MKPPKKAVVLSSGGLDSTTAMAIAVRDGFEIYSLSFHYGQRHSVELDAARNIAKALGARRHLVLRVDLDRIGGSALTEGFEVPKDRPLGELGQDIPVTYVPARNTVFLALAVGWAEVLGSWDLFIGVNALDYSGYPDCRPEFIRAFERSANLGTRAGVQGQASFRIHTPLIRMSKAEIIRTGMALGVDFSLTHSCYDPVDGRRACGRCDSCLLRKKGFAEAGFPDPVSYSVHG